VTKYMVLIPNGVPEYVQADSFGVDDRGILRLYTENRESAAFYHWLGIKEVATPVSAVSTSTTSNPARAKIVRSGVK
jgi:hypothetical protein